MAQELIPFWEEAYQNENAFIADLTAYRFERQYDLMMSFGTLHFVQKKDWKDFINRAKSYTEAGGLHIMQIFTDTVPASEEIAPFAVGLAKDGEIRELYSDWEILKFQSYTFEDEHPGVPKHMHSSNKIVARKIGSYFSQGKRPIGGSLKENDL